MQPITLYLSDARDQFHKYKVAAELAMAQVSDRDLFDVPFAGGNSIAIIAKHLAGNMLSRWTDFLTTDGEKKDRNRDDEFEMDPGWSRDELMAYWDRGWSCLSDVMDSLTEEDLARSVTIRGEEHSVVRAISRQMTHYAYHVGQIVLLARVHAGDSWQTLSIARRESEQFNARHWGARSTRRPDPG